MPPSFRPELGDTELTVGTPALAVELVLVVALAGVEE
jgi:hypothetical protein